MKSNIFIDSNIWIYAFLDSEKDHAKQQRVLSLVEGIPTDSTVIASVQVVNKFHWILSRKYGIDDATIKTKVQKGSPQLPALLRLISKCIRVPSVFVASTTSLSGIA